MDALWLGFEAWVVIGLRAMTIAGGGPAARAEAQRMVSEKVELGLALHTQMLTGALGMMPATASHRAMEQVLLKVRNNRARLSKP
jgi:hypothetical protein